MKIVFVIALTTVSAGLLTGCGDSNSSSPPAQSATPANNSSPVVQPEVYAQKKMDLSSLTQAVQQYKAAEGNYPKTLQDLVPDYIAKIPAAPPGYKINYDPDSGSVTVVQQ